MWLTDYPAMNRRAIAEASLRDELEVTIAICTNLMRTDLDLATTDYGQRTTDPPAHRSPDKTLMALSLPVPQSLQFRLSFPAACDIPDAQFEIINGFYSNKLFFALFGARFTSIGTG